MVKNPTITETIRLDYSTLVWARAENGRKQNSPKKVLYMNLAATRLRGRPRNRWQYEVREDGRIVGNSCSCTTIITLQHHIVLSNDK
jgi:hypothetical protein